VLRPPLENAEALQHVQNEWADIIPPHFDTFPLVDI
jgi:uncharacterized protein YbdZ (MbtH family)